MGQREVGTLAIEVSQKVYVLIVRVVTHKIAAAKIHTIMRYPNGVTCFLRGSSAKNSYRDRTALYFNSTQPPAHSVTKQIQCCGARLRRIPVLTNRPNILSVFSGALLLAEWQRQPCLDTVSSRSAALPRHRWRPATRRDLVRRRRRTSAAEIGVVASRLTGARKGCVARFL